MILPSATSYWVAMGKQFQLKHTIAKFDFVTIGYIFSTENTFLSVFVDLHDLNGGKSLQVRVMVWCHQATRL